MPKPAGILSFLLQGLACPHAHLVVVGIKGQLCELVCQCHRVSVTLRQHAQLSQLQCSSTQHVMSLPPPMAAAKADGWTGKAPSPTHTVRLGLCDGAGQAWSPTAGYAGRFAWAAQPSQGTAPPHGCGGYWSPTHLFLLPVDLEPVLQLEGQHSHIVSLNSPVLVDVTTHQQVTGQSLQGAEGLSAIGSVDTELCPEAAKWGGAGCSHGASGTS